MKRKRLVVSLSIVGVLLVAIVCLIVFLPGLSKPRDLGIEADKSLSDSVSAKLSGFSSRSKSFGLNSADPITLNSQEITSYLAYSTPSGFLLNSAQARINDDNTIDVAGSIDKELFIEYVMTEGYDEDDLKKEVPMIGLVPSKVNIYAKIEGEVNAAQGSDIDVLEFEIMGFSLPESLYSKEELSELLTVNIDSYMKNTAANNGLYFQSATIQNGEIVIK